MKKVLVWFMLIVMTMTMLVSTGFAEGDSALPQEQKVELVSAKNTGIEAITVTWKKLEGAKSYRVYRKVSGESEWKKIKTVSDVASYTDKKAVNGKKYDYTVRAEFKNNGNTTLSDYNTAGLSVTCSAKKAKVALKSVTAGLNTAKIEWEAMTGADKYRVYRKTADSDWKRLDTIEGTSYTDTKLTKGVTYYYSVRGWKRDGEKTIISGMSSKGLSVKAKTSVKPTLKSVKNVGIQTVKISWEKTLGAEAYRVYRKAPGGSWKTIADGVTGASYTDKTVQNGKQYVYSVRAYRKISGKRVYSAYNKTGLSITAKVSDKVKLKSITAGFNSAKVTWEKMTGANRYYVYRKTAGQSWEKIATTTATSYTDTKLTKGTTYYYTVRGVNKSSAGTVKAPYNKTGLSVKAQVPSTVKMKSVKEMHFRTVKVTWSSVSGAEGYDVYRKTSKGEWKNIGKTTETSYVDDTLEMDTKYFYMVRAYCMIDGKKVRSGYDKTGISIKLKSKINPKKPMVAITYDDGPGKYTNQILDVFEKYDAHATFFVVGRNVANNKSVVKRAYNLGCEIGNHSYTHPSLTSLSNSEVKSQINKTDSAVKNAIGTTTTLLRPPYGAQNDRVRSAVNKPFIMWSVDTRDWEHRSASKTLASVKKNTKDGSIILMHDIHKATATAAESVVSYLTKKGYQLVTVSELAYYKGIKMKSGKSYSRFY